MTDIWSYRDTTRPETTDLAGFQVVAIDGPIGNVDAATYDVGGSYVVVNANPWLEGRRVLLPAGMIERVDRDTGTVHIGRTREEIRSAPELERGAVTDAYRQRIGAYYGPGAPAPQPVRRAQAGRRSQSGGRRARSSGRRSRSSRRSDGDEPTKQELYDTAKRLGIEGRSKMNKRELARAVERAGKRQTGGRSAGGRKANPVDVQKFLDGVNYPTRKGDLIREAEKSRASSKVRQTLERLPDKRFKAPTEVSREIGRLSGR